MLPIWLRPQSASLARSIGEGVAGILPLVLLALLVQLVLRGGVAFGLISAMEWLWLAVWPAWRMRRLSRDRWWQRIPLGFARLLLLAATLAAISAGVTALEWAPTGVTLPRVASAIGKVPLTIFFRVIFVAGLALGRPVRRRLRWQLMASHVGVIVLTIMSLTAAGSLVGIALGLNGIRPDAPMMAQSVADELVLTRSVAPLDPARVQQVIDGAASGRLAVKGQPALAGLIPRYPRPDPIIVQNPAGHILAETADAPADLRRYPNQLPVLARLRRLALAGRAVALRPVGNLRGDPLVFAAAPVRAPGGKIVAVVLLQANDIQVTPTRFVQGAIALFGVATVVLILISSIPLLALSFLFSYFLARSLTRRLEAVSAVATAIAAGNLSERAPVRERNEVGRLAGDINRMAAHLETTIGELQQARAQAEEALRLRQQLVANASHELRTPLAVVRAHLDALLMRQPVSPAATQPEAAEIAVPATTLEAVTAEIGRLESLVEDLFTLSRAQSDALEVHCEPVDAAAIAGEVAAVMRPLVQRERAITLTVESLPGLPRALADAGRLRQILSNLVRNAARHTPEGGIIALSVRAQPGWIVIGVADTGEGIAPEHMPHIFDRFYRVDESRSRGGGGAGLGLAIVRELVERMGGRVTAESVPGEGTCFQVYLPAARERIRNLTMGV